MAIICYIYAGFGLLTILVGLLAYSVFDLSQFELADYVKSSSILMVMLAITPLTSVFSFIMGKALWAHKRWAVLSSMAGSGLNTLIQIAIPAFSLYAGGDFEFSFIGLTLCLSLTVYFYIVQKELKETPFIKHPKEILHQ